ncbi:lysophospholipid acyltransferase family protein [Hydrogenivirga sp.]
MGDCPITPVGRYVIKPLCPLAKPLFKRLFRIEVHGEENIPRSGPFIVASNHRSHLDPPVLNAAFPEPLVFLAKEELFRPPLGWFIRHMRAVPIRRGSGDVDTLEMTLGLLHRGCHVAIFPEGTRARPGEFLRPKPGVGLLAIKSGVPVVPVLIEGTDHVFPRGASFPKPGHPIRVFIGKPKLYSSYEDNLKGYRKAALEIMEDIKSLLPRPS